jgi:hypothetical protein
MADTPAPSAAGSWLVAGLGRDPETDEDELRSSPFGIPERAGQVEKPIPGKAGLTAGRDEAAP